MMKLFVLNLKLVVLVIVLLVGNSRATDDNIDTMAVNTLFQHNPTSPQLIKIGKGLFEVETKIKAFNTSMMESLEPDLLEKFAVISRKMVFLRKRINDQKITAPHFIRKTSVDLLRKFYQTLANQMIEIRKSVKNVAGDVTVTSLIKAVEELNFQVAENILDKIDNDLVIPKLVYEVYANNTENIKLLLNFTKSLSTINRSLLMLMSLQKELESHGRLDLFLTIDLIRKLELEILSQQLYEKSQYLEVKNFHDRLRTSLKKNATDMMASAMLSHKFERDEKIKNFLVELYNLDSNLSNEVMFEVIDRVYGKINNKEIIDNIYFQCYVPQRDDSLVYIYEKMRDSKQLDTAIIKLAQYAYHIQKSNYSSEILMAKRHKEFISIWYALPKSLQNLYEAECVCLKNMETLEYLYAASDGYSYDTDRRFIFTWVPRNRVNQGFWYIKNDFPSEDFYFVNKDHFNEYMYASEYGMGKNQRYGYVFTWKLKGQVGSRKSAWNIEIYENQLRIRNAFNEKLLCVTSNTYPQNRNEDRRYVFTMSKEYFVFDRSCLWTLETCG